MRLYQSAFLPLLCFDDNTINSFVDHLRRYENEPIPEDVSKATGIPITICRERIQLILYLNSCIQRNRDRAFQAIRRRKLKDFLD